MPSRRPHYRAKDAHAGGSVACAAIGAVREVAGHLLLRRLDSDDLRDEIGSAIPGRLTLKCRSPVASPLFLAHLRSATFDWGLLLGICVSAAHSASGILSSEKLCGRPFF